MINGLELLRSANRENAQQRQRLTMAVATAIVVAATLLENDDLFAARLGDNFGRNGKAVCVLNFAAVTGQQDITQRYGIASFTLDLFNSDLVSSGDSILLAARAHDCEHGLPSNQNYDAHITSHLLMQMFFQHMGKTAPLPLESRAVNRIWLRSLRKLRSIAAITGYIDSGLVAFDGVPYQES